MVALREVTLLKLFCFLSEKEIYSIRQELAPLGAQGSWAPFLLE